MGEPARSLNYAVMEHAGHDGKLQREARKASLNTGTKTKLFFVLLYTFSGLPTLSCHVNAPQSSPLRPTANLHGDLKGKATVQSMY